VARFTLTPTGSLRSPHRADEVDRQPVAFREAAGEVVAFLEAEAGAADRMVLVFETNSGGFWLRSKPSKRRFTAPADGSLFSIWK
jgi:hypothetical protein